MRGYHKLDYETTPVVDSGNFFYCCGDCQNGDTDVAQCGSMKVCRACIQYHKINSGEYDYSDDFYDTDDSDDEFDADAGDWIHSDRFKVAFIQRMQQGKPWKYVLITSRGPSLRIKDSVQGSLTVNSAASALVAAGHNPEEAEWWIFLAGWYDDCPLGVTKYI